MQELCFCKLAKNPGCASKGCTCPQGCGSNASWRNWLCFDTLVCCFCWLGKWHLSKTGLQVIIYIHICLYNFSMCIWYLCVYLYAYLWTCIYIYMHGACMYWTLANKPGFPGLRGVSKTSLWLGVMMSWCHASHIWFLCKHQAKKKQKLLLKRRCCFFTWASQGERNKKKDLRLSVVNSYLLRVSCHHMFLAFSCYFVFIKGLNSYSVIWGIFFGITTRMLKKVWIIYLHWGEQWKQCP